MTIDEVYEITGETVDQKDLRKAEALIGAYTNTQPDAVLDLEDTYWLAQAVAWQAVHKQETDPSVKSLRQGDLAVTFRDGLTPLAPAAHAALRRLSWAGHRQPQSLYHVYDEGWE